MITKHPFSQNGKELSEMNQLSGSSKLQNITSQSGKHMDQYLIIIL
jgi:hypothetical protein